MKRWSAVIAGALLLPLAYPPFHLLLPSFVALVPVVYLLEEASEHPRPLRRVFANGFWYGLLAQGLVLYWIVAALWHFTPLALLGYLATISILALWHGLMLLGTWWTRRRTRLPLWLLLPVFWTAVEWCIGHQGDIRFPWLGLGTSLTGFPMLVQAADIVGARGITFLLVMANVALAEAWRVRRTPAAGRRLLLVSAGIFAALTYGMWRFRTLPLEPVGRVAVIQPNVNDKWASEARDSAFRAVFALSDEAIRATHPDLVVWPEVAVPNAFDLRPDWAHMIGEQAREARAAMVVGALDYRRTGPGQDDYDFWNSAFAFDPDGAMQPTVYHKRYLVPITERVPFVNPHWFDMEFFGAFSKGTSGPVFSSTVGSFGILICFESVFPGLSRDYRLHGADFLLNITNDAWFGRSAAPSQHLAHLVMRAIETRAGIGRAGNSGISGFVDPLGRITDRTPLDVRTYRTGTLLTTHVVPPATRWGDWVGVGSLLAVGALLGLATWRPR